MKRLIDQPSPGGGACRVEWHYDALDRRIRQTTWSWLVQSNLWVVTEDLGMVSDPLLFGRHVIELNASNNALVRSYVWGLDLSERMDGAGGVGGLLWVTLHTGSGPAAGTHFAAYDGSGNIVALSAASDGSATARYEYGPFGDPIRLSGPAAASNPFRFSTKRTGSTTDLVLYEYRVYSASMVKWANRDPINEPRFNLLIRSQNPFNWDEEKNLYGFVRNNLASAYDPLGLSCCICVFKRKIGKLTINSNCKGVLSIWVIDEGSALAAGATAGSTVSAGGYVLGGTTYKK
jgi:RHS repeat-associated protein